MPDQLPQTQVPSPPQQKPCRACDGFKEFAAEQKHNPATAKKPKSTATAAAAGAASEPKMPCPPDSRQLGRHTWTFLHTMAAYYPDQPTLKEQANAAGFIRAFAQLYPCSYCAQHLQTELKTRPPRVSSSKEFSQWMCEVHNEVNERLGKPQFDCSKVFERWRDGCADT